MEYKFEICANGVASCIAAQKGGADRVELCAGIPEGGTTPSQGCIVTARRSIEIGLNVIIRPRSGDFLYTPAELDEMEADIHAAIDAGADGLVFGCLTAQGDVDMIAMQRLMHASAGKPVTFHRAFDRCRDPFKALQDITELGCTRILTSGQQPTAPQGSELLKELNAKAHDIIIMAGSGVNENNIKQLATDTGIKEFHFSAREAFNSNMEYHNPNIYMGKPGAVENAIMQTTEQRVRKTIASLC